MTSYINTCQIIKAYFIFLYCIMHFVFFYNCWHINNPNAITLLLIDKNFSPNSSASEQPCADLDELWIRIDPFGQRLNSGSPAIRSLFRFTANFRVKQFGPFLEKMLVLLATADSRWLRLCPADYIWKFFYLFIDFISLCL